MPCISMFYGILIYMYAFDNQQHKLPHIHVEHQDNKAVYNIETGELLDGSLKNRQHRLVQAWIELHQEDLMADWHLVILGKELFKIDPLR